MNKPMSIDPLIMVPDSVIRSAWEGELHTQAARFAGLAQTADALDGVRMLVSTIASLIDESRSTDQALRAVAAKKDMLTGQLSNLQTRLGVSPTEILLLLVSTRSTLKAALVEAQAIQKRECTLEQVLLILGRLGMFYFDAFMHSSDDSVFSADIVDLDYALLYERTRQLAITDALTGLFSYGYFLDRLAEERARAERYQRLLSLILIDVDRFKAYNDRHGHPAGNEVLKGVARVLREGAREVDLVARFGGEEFVILVPEANRSSANHMAERIRQQIAETPFPNRELQPGGRLTISAGVATYPIDADSADRLVQSADQSLYRAKRAGRNRVVSFAPQTAATLRYRADREVRRVSLVGSFNNWDKTADPMVRADDGSFEFSVALCPGTYRYKFVLDDQEWVSCAGTEREPDNFGGENNVLRVAPLESAGAPQ